MYDFFSYSDPEASYNDVFNRFNETTIIFEEKGSGNYSDFKLFYVEDLAYVRTYRDAFKVTVEGGATKYPTASEIAEELGWFVLPPMESQLEGVAKNLRPTGGPNENFGILSTGVQSKDEIAVDFLKYLFSPQGQQAIYTAYESSSFAPITMRQLVKNVSVPESIDYTSLIGENGCCSSNPYIMFGKGSDMVTTTIGDSSAYVKDEVAKILSAYVRGKDRVWAADDEGKKLFDALKSGFANYAEDKNFIYTDYAKVAEKTNNLVNSPYSSVS